MEASSKPSEVSDQHKLNKFVRAVRSECLDKAVRVRLPVARRKALMRVRELAKIHKVDQLAYEKAVSFLWDEDQVFE